MVTMKTRDIIHKYLPEIDMKEIKWNRLYPSSFSLYDWCMFKFLLKYHTKIPVSYPEIMEIGKIGHDLKDKFYKIVDYKKILFHARKWNLSKITLSRYVMAHFKISPQKTVLHGAMLGFSHFEANRIVEIIKIFDNDKKILKYLNPVTSEIKLKSETYGGIIDTIFRDPLDGEYIVNDWKDGLSCPNELSKNYINQVHFYRILLEEIGVYDRWNDGMLRIIPKHWTLIFPRYQKTFSGEFSPITTNTLRLKIEIALENINQHIFDMRCDNYHCGFGRKGKCEYFNKVCKNIMENEFDMIFDIEDDSVEEIWFDF